MQGRIRRAKRLVARYKKVINRTSRARRGPMDDIERLRRDIALGDKSAERELDRLLERRGEVPDEARAWAEKLKRAVRGKIGEPIQEAEIGRPPRIKLVWRLQHEIPELGHEDIVVIIGHGGRWNPEETSIQVEGSETDFKNAVKGLTAPLLPF